MKKRYLLPGLSVLLLGAAGCDVDKVEEGEMPDVDVSADAGELPEYEVRKVEEGRAPDLDVDVEGGEMPEYDVDGPDVDVGTKTVEVEVPDIDVDMPDDDDADAGLDGEERMDR